MSRDKVTWNRKPGSVYSLAVSDKDMAMIPAGLQVSSGYHPAAIEEPVVGKDLQQECRGAASKQAICFLKAEGELMVPPGQG